jgi:DNA-binding transcriptional ArsR family regulator
MTDDEIDFSKFKLNPEDALQLAEAEAVPSTKVDMKGGVSEKREFVQIPRKLVLALKGASAGTMFVVLELLHRRLKENGANVVTLANCSLKNLGIKPSTKSLALSDLERRGLIRVERKKGKSPRVHLGHLWKS